MSGGSQGNYELNGLLRYDTDASNIVFSSLTTPFGTYGSDLTSADSFLIIDIFAPPTSSLFQDVTYNIGSSFSVRELEDNTFDVWGSGLGPSAATVVGNAPILPGSVPDPGPPVNAVISGDDFDFVVESGVPATQDFSGSGTAQVGPPADIDDSGYVVDWIDENSVAISLDTNSFGGDLSMTLSDLNFVDANGNAVEIENVTYNRFASGINEFLGDITIGQPDFADFIEPSISFGPTSFTATYGLLNQGLIADGVTHIFDIQTAGSSTTTPVPLPATAWLLFAGLLTMAGIKRRRPV